MRAAGDVLIPRDSPRLVPARILLDFMQLVESTHDQHSGTAYRMRELIRMWKIANKLVTERVNEAELAQHFAEEDGDEVTDEDVSPRHAR